MKKIFILTLVLLGCTCGETFAQGPLVTAGKSAKVILRSNEQMMLIMRQLSSEGLEFNGTLTALVANTNLPNPSQVHSFDTYINSTWPARAESALVWKSPTLNVEQAAQLLLKQEPITHLSAKQQQDFYLISYPALVLEGPFVAEPQQLSYALAYYRNILEGKPVKATLPQALSDWARSMAAVTDLGLLGTSNDIFLILKNAKKPFPPLVTPWTDLITVQALLQHEAYDAIEELAKFRLTNIESNHPELLSSYWHHIAEYMNNIGHPLSITPNKIAGYFFQRPMPSKIQRLLAQYNPYNLFYVQPSVKVFENGLALRQNFLQKMQQEQVAEQEDLTDLISQQLSENIRPETMPSSSIAPEQLTPENMGFSRYNNRAIWQTDPKEGYEKLIRRALQECVTLRQQIELTQIKLNGNLRPYRTKERLQLERQLANLQMQYQAAEARLHQIHTEHAKNTPIDQISYLTYKEPLDIENDNTLPFSTHFDPTMSTSSLGLLTFFHAPVSSREEANLKQALLDYAEHNVTLAQQAARNSNDPELLRQHQNAIDKLSYIHREIIAGAPYEIIVVNAYGVSAEETTSTLFEIPPMPYRFEGHGRYSSFEAPVKNKSDGDAKQKLFDDIYYHQEAFFQQQVLMYRYEIRAMEQDKRLIGRKNRAQLLEKYRFELAEAEANLLRAQQRIERLLNQIKQGTAIKEIH
ncbi:hypothetical protein [Candidatus Avelusimicrobium luingense]|uniref:hypothetical protein n=1 Tax=Candidatus Avelusimicrobium luingense TaxID=3416211 RepID=UPI003D0C6337